MYIDKKIQDLSPVLCLFVLLFITSQDTDFACFVAHIHVQDLCMHALKTAHWKFGWAGISVETVVSVRDVSDEKPTDDFNAHMYEKKKSLFYIIAQVRTIICSARQNMATSA